MQLIKQFFKMIHVGLIVLFKKKEEKRNLKPDPTACPTQTLTNKTIFGQVNRKEEAIKNYRKAMKRLKKE